MARVEVKVICVEIEVTFFKYKEAVWDHCEGGVVNKEWPRGQ